MESKLYYCFSQPVTVISTTVNNICTPVDTVDIQNGIDVQYMTSCKIRTVILHGQRTLKKLPS